MTRLARNQSSTNIYHIILRGNNKQQIFLDDEDYTRFLNIVSGYKKRYDFMLLAYCLMGNHIHLLIKTDETPLSTIMKSIVVKFVYYYNVKYQRVGHLFQDRFKSEPVETETYLQGKSLKNLLSNSSLINKMSTKFSWTKDFCFLQT